MILRLGAAALVLVALAGCGGAEAPPGPRPSAAAWGRLPPNDVEAMDEIYGDELAAQGVRLVRAGLVDRSGGGFEYDPQGTHLALYVEPVSRAAAQAYVDRIVPVTELFASTVFVRWSGLASFDVCQEPPPAVDGSAEPDPVTQVTLWREEASDIEWATFDLVDLLVLSRQTHPRHDRPRALVTTSPRIARFPAYREALREAEALAGPASD